MMADDIDRSIAEAKARGRDRLRDEPRAAAARFEAATGLVHVEMTNGCSFAFPARRAQGLETAEPAALAGVEVLGQGIGLRWDALDVDLSVPGLLTGLFGTRAWLDRQRVAHAGAARSQVKSAAARANGAKGGRPAKRA